MRRPLLAVLLCLAFTGLACGDEDTERALQDARETAERAVGADELRARVKELKQDARRFRERARDAGEELGRRVRQVLEDIEQAVPEASLPAPRAEGRTQENEISAFLTRVIELVDDYWTRTLKQSGLPEPRVGYVWVEPGDRIRTRCGAIADDNAAFYCSGDDTIYLAQKLASDLYQGIADNFPGEQAGAGNAVGDFGLAYVLAHEYAHNVQFELGFYELQDPRDGVKAFELQADCMAGLWANAVEREGQIDASDVEEAISTAQAAGDFDYGNAQHHGTPEERRAAWLDGFETGEPARCRAYVPGV